MSTPEREHQIQKIADQFQLINHATIKLATTVKDLRQNKVDFNRIKGSSKLGLICRQKR